MTIRDPATVWEWQEAVDLAYGALALDSARQYGLITGGPGVSVERCEEILRRGKERGILPGTEAIERFMRDAFPQTQHRAREARR